MQKILVTGSSGSIGTALYEALIKGGYEVAGADIRPNRWNEDINRRTVRVDLTKGVETLALLPKDADVIIHLAAHSRVWDLVERPELGAENIRMLENVLEHAKAHGIRKVIFSSSREVYGNLAKDAYREEDASRDACENAYALSKFDGETMLAAYRKSGIDSVILRFGNVYGRYDTYNRVVPLFLAHCIREKPIRIFGTGKVLDFVHIDDAVAGLLKALAQFDSVKNDVFNVASGRGTDLAELANMLKHITGSTIDVSSEENRTGEVMRYVGNIDKAKARLGFSPRVPLEAGLEKAAAWYRDLYERHREMMPTLRAE
jgi:nucleoside-diphosphate-sugar epimerase